MRWQCRMNFIFQLDVCSVLYLLRVSWNMSIVFSETCGARKECERNNLIFLKLLVKPNENSWPHLQKCNGIGLLTWSTWNNCLKHLTQSLDSLAELSGHWSINVIAHKIQMWGGKKEMMLILKKKSHRINVTNTLA